MSAVNPIALQKYLKDVRYPVSKTELVKRAIEQGATKPIREALAQLGNTEFKTPMDVSKAVSRTSKR